MSQRSLSFLEFFAGAGLVRLALAPTWYARWANDIDPRKAEIYLHNFPNEGFVLGDVADVAAKDLPVPVQMAWASFPCQDLSLAGWQRGMTAARSGTFWAFWQIMADLQENGMRPPMIVLENVPGLLYGDNFEGLCEALAALHLRFGGLVMDAKQFLPQSRARVFIVAMDDTVDVRPWTDTKPHNGKTWTPKALCNAYDRLSSELKERWVWWDVPTPSDRPVSLEKIIEPNPPHARWNSVDETEKLSPYSKPGTFSNTIIGGRMPFS